MRSKEKPKKISKNDASSIKLKKQQNHFKKKHIEKPGILDSLKKTFEKKT